MKVAHRSASLWGCELKCCTGYYSVTGRGQPPCEAVSWNASKLPWQLAPFVSLLVRLWVEMLSRRQMNGSRPSASLWGCELKYHPYEFFVSFRIVSLLVRLWVEMLQCLSIFRGSDRQPPCEAVSWNAHISTSYARIPLSASLWGCELKCKLSSRGIIVRFVSLLVRLWVEIK